MTEIAEIKVKGSRQETLIEIHIDVHQIESCQTEHEIVKLFSDIAQIASKVYPGSRVSFNRVANRIAKSPRKPDGVTLLPGSAVFDIKPRSKPKGSSWLSRWFDK